MSNPLGPDDFQPMDLLQTVHWNTGGPTFELPIFQVLKVTKDAVLAVNPRHGFIELETGHDFRWVEKINEDDVEEEPVKVSLWKKIGNLLKKF